MVFVLLEPKVKTLLAYILMMQFFDVAPNLLFGMYVWDYGAILMMVAGAQVFFRTPVLAVPKHAYLTVLKIFLVWLLICFLWSLLVYRYPFMHTLKNARQMILGYFMTVIFIRLFSVQPGSFEFMMKWIYRLTFALMPVVLLQYALHRPLLSGLISDYEGVVRYVAVFFPFCLLNFWIIGTKVLSSEKLALHEWIYAALTLTTVALSFTRGIYISVILAGALLVFTMARDGSLKASSLGLVTGAGIFLIAGVLATGVANRVVGRAASGLDLLGSSDTSSLSRKKDDTFSGRLGLAAERFSLVWAQNPLVGYGFLHEDDVPSDVRARLKLGTPLGGTAADPTAYSRAYAFSGNYVLGFYTADIAWPNIFISAGCVGALLLFAVMLTLVFEHYQNPGASHPMGYAVRTGLFLQLIVMFLLMFDGSTFYSSVHIPAFLLAGYALTGGSRWVSANIPVARVRPANLMS